MTEADYECALCQLRNVNIYKYIFTVLSLIAHVPKWNAIVQSCDIRHLQINITIYNTHKYIFINVYK